LSKRDRKSAREKTEPEQTPHAVGLIAIQPREEQLETYHEGKRKCSLWSCREEGGCHATCWEGNNIMHISSNLWQKTILLQNFKDLYGIKGRYCFYRCRHNTPPNRLRGKDSKVGSSQDSSLDERRLVRDVRLQLRGVSSAHEAAM
jgi:hypothetical protein